MHFGGSHHGYEDDNVRRIWLFEPILFYQNLHRTDYRDLWVALDDDTIIQYKYGIYYIFIKYAISR